MNADEILYEHIKTDNPHDEPYPAIMDKTWIVCGGDTIKVNVTTAHSGKIRVLVTREDD